MCVKELAPRPDLFPTGLPKLPANMSYIVYGPFFCEDNVYAAFRLKPLFEICVEYVFFLPVQFEGRLRTISK